MPFVVVPDASGCPTSKSWGVFTQGADGGPKGNPHGCFVSKAKAREQQKALYASVPDAKSAAPRPPNLRDADPDSDECCRTCHMFDDEQQICWGFGNTQVSPDEVCDEWAPESEANRSANAEVKMTVTTASTPPAKLANTIASRKAHLPKHGVRETRTLPVEELELREGPSITITNSAGVAQEKKLLRFSGYASVFNRSYKVSGIEEKIAPGAFKRSLGNPNLDVVLRTEHGNLPLARTTGHETLADGTTIPTLRLSEDETGLHVDALLDPDDPDVQRLVPKYRRGDLKEMSFAFRCQDDVWSDDYTQREIRVAEIHRGDVSIVTYGASPTTESTLRSEEAITELRAVGAETFIGSMHDYAFGYVTNHFTAFGERATIEELENRTGKVISSASMETLRKVLDLFATADDAVDEGQALLSDLMGVPNPNTDAHNASSEAVTDAEQLKKLGRTAEQQDFWDKIHALAEEGGWTMRDDNGTIQLEAPAERTVGDEARTTPHLLDTVLGDLAHAKQHHGRLSDDDVKGDAEAVQFNADHLGSHLESAQAHAQKLDKHLSEHPSDPKIFRAEREKLTAMRAESDEERDAPTWDDYDIAFGLKQAKLALAYVKASQLADPDYETDPDDQAVMAQIVAAEANIDQAIINQGRDGRCDDDDGARSEAEPTEEAGSIKLPEDRYDEYEIELRTIRGLR